MPIKNWPSSRKQTQAFQATLNHLVQLKKIPSSVLKMPLSPPLPIYNVGVRAVILNQNLIACGKLVAWRYFAGGDSEETSVSADVDLSTRPRVTHITYGESVFQTLNALENTAKSPELGNTQFEPRLLRIPGVLMQCLWFIPLEAGNEKSYVVPHHTVLQCDRWTPMPADKFYEEMLLPGAQRVLAKRDESPGVAYPVAGSSAARLPSG
jgi:hypothetical protein